MPTVLATDKQSVGHCGVDKFDSARLIGVAEIPTLNSSTLASLEASEVAPRLDSCSVAGMREVDLDWSGIVHETNDVRGGCRGMGGDIVESPMMVAGLVRKVGADGEDGAAETVRPIFVHDEAVAWRQKSGALMS